MVQVMRTHAVCDGCVIHMLYILVLLNQVVLKFFISILLFSFLPHLNEVRQCL